MHETDTKFREALDTFLRVRGYTLDTSPTANLVIPLVPTNHDNSTELTVPTAFLENAH
jgi:hypothetical protein